MCFGYWCMHSFISFGSTMVLFYYLARHEAGRGRGCTLIGNSFVPRIIQVAVCTMIGNLFVLILSSLLSRDFKWKDP